MRKIAVFARGLIMSACVLLTMTACSEEELVAPEENGGADNNTTITTPTDIPMKTIRISAGMAQGEGGEMTRTTLNGQKVLWDANDQYTIINQDPTDTPSKTLRVVLNEPGSGLGIKVSYWAPLAATTEVNLKYSALKVVVGGKDVTEEVINTSSNNDKDNSYMIGAKNAQQKYQYKDPGNEMKARLFDINKDIIKFSKAFYIARRATDETNSPAKDKDAIVTISGIEWKYNVGSWNTFDENNNGDLMQGSTIIGDRREDVTSYKWVHGVNHPVTLKSGDEGKTYGIFEGQIPANADVDESTMAVYPVGVCTGYNNDKLTINIPQEQSYVENSFDHKANIMVGNLTMTEDGEYDAKFKNMMGILKLSLKGSGNISTIMITDKAGSKLWGTATISAGNFGEGISTDKISGGSATITMNCNNAALTDEAKDFYIVVPAGAFSNGFDVTINTTEGEQNYKEIVKTSKSNTITRNGIVEMPVITVENCETFNIENPVLTQYLDRGPYSSWGANSYFSGSFASECVDKDYPMSKNITWAGNASEYKVTLTDLTKKKDVFTDRTVTGTSYAFINMIPGHKYSYEVKDGVNVVTSGKFITEGRARMITVEDTWNFRDLGGWTSTLGGKVQHDLIYRSGSLNGKWQLPIKNNRSNIIEYSSADQTNPSNYIFSDKSRQQLIDLGITGELDLRATSGGNDKIHAYAIGKNNTGISNWDFINLTFNDAQSSPLTASTAIDCMAWIINHVLNDKPVVFHCKSGADRTGMLSYLIHSLLGVEEGNLAVDYEMTNFSHEQKEVTGTSAIRGKYTRQNTNGMYKEAFTTFDDNKGKNRQEKAYYYLNRHFGDKAIKSSDLDNFIEKMLGMKKGIYQHPEFARDNGIDIESVK